MDNSYGVSTVDQRPLFLVNVYIIHTVRFLNKFSAVCEQKLAEVHRRILRIDATLTLLEAKLNSIDCLDKVRESSGHDVSPNLPISTVDRVPEDGGGITLPSSEAVQISSPSIRANEQPIILEHSSPRAEEPSFTVMKDDPQFSRFFRMLRVGVPEKAVKLQMSLEGYDPSLLEKPEASASVV